jgi:hypothetical protein
LKDLVPCGTGTSSESEEFLRRIEAAKRLQSCDRYAVVAWLLMPIASQIFPFFEIPNWAIRLVFIGGPINSPR